MSLGSVINEVNAMLNQAYAINAKECGTGHFLADEALLKLVRYWGRSDGAIDLIADRYDNLPKFHDDKTRVF